MFLVDYEYSGKKFELFPYCTSQEKDLLLLGAMESSNLDHALQICGICDDTLSSLSDLEKTAMLYKLREISVGEDINLKFKCKHCNSGNENTLNIADIVTSSNIKNDNITDMFINLTEDTLPKFVNVDVDELNIDEYEDLLKEVKESITKFKFVQHAVCQKCGLENPIRIDEPNFVIDNMSEDSLPSMYQTYNDMTFFGKYTKQDIDSLYPFERVILVSLLNRTREDLNK